MANGGLAWLGHQVGVDGLSLEGILGKLMVPVAWILGIPWTDAHVVGQLIGLEFVLNEFVAFARLQSLLSTGTALDPRSLIITIYALTSFANFGSVAMTIAGLGEMAPSRRHDLARLGLKAMLAGLLATLLTAAVAGLAL
jgi:CNT family concentrative nucleoside transporter